MRTEYKRIFIREIKCTYTFISEMAINSAETQNLKTAKTTAAPA